MGETVFSLSQKGWGKLHEASIAQSLLDIVIETASENKAKFVKSVKIDIGRLAAIENDALMFAFDALKEGTIAENARLYINDVPIVGRCNVCSFDSEYESFDFCCKNCGSYDVILISGEELNIKEIEVEDE
ncbi:MAG: hydrogenase nickel incorporation protein HypA/HybF [Deferribacteres bacterium]|nr:hydrogenase nickel incorporation protein HypA/HybF [Deferribacteres bacterium]